MLETIRLLQPLSEWSFAVAAMGTNGRTPLRVCVVAENASFQFGGEASLPLHYYSRLRARGVEAWLIVHGRTRKELETLFPDDEGRIQFIPDKWFHKLIWSLTKYLPRRVADATLGTLMFSRRNHPYARGSASQKDVLSPRRPGSRTNFLPAGNWRRQL